MKVRLILLLLYFSYLLAQNISADEKNPDMALLEFLGSFETDDEQWFDPTLLIDEEILDERLEEGQNDEQN